MTSSSAPRRPHPGRTPRPRDHRDARTAATRLIRDLGFAPFFAGGASNACLTEAGGPLRMREIDVADATAAFAQAVGTAR
jgi:predicted dinucleotide-binding enzyme